MKKIFTLLLGITLISSGVTFAQNNAGKADDEARISITPQVTDQEIPAAAKKNLLNKMKQICAKNGLAGDGNNPFFIMDASVDVLSKELTPTAPPMHALSLQINFFIKDAGGAIYSETSYTTKGVGKNETKAYLQGLKNINTSKGQFKAMVDRGKEKIVEYYNSQCDFVISKAKAMQKQGRNDQAIKVLQSVPPVCKECYDMCMEVMAEIEPSDDFVEEGAAGTAAAASTTSEASAESKATGDESTEGSATAATKTTGINIKVGDRVWVVFNNDSFFRKVYGPGKVLKVGDESTKGESQFISLGSGGSSVWTKDIIVKWHAASTEELKEGAVILYTGGVPTKESSFRPGVIVSVDEMYKNELSIKGRWGDIYKINPKWIAIPDIPKLQIP